MLPYCIPPDIEIATQNSKSVTLKLRDSERNNDGVQVRTSWKNPSKPKLPLEYEYPPSSRYLTDWQQMAMRDVISEK